MGVFAEIRCAASDTPHEHSPSSVDFAKLPLGSRSTSRAWEDCACKDRVVGRSKRLVKPGVGFLFRRGHVHTEASAILAQPSHSSVELLSNFSRQHCQTLSPLACRLCAPRLSMASEQDLTEPRNFGLVEGSAS